MSYFLDPVEYYFFSSGGERGFGHVLRCCSLGGSGAFCFFVGECFKDGQFFSTFFPPGIIYIAKKKKAYVDLTPLFFSYPLDPLYTLVSIDPARKSASLIYSGRNL